MANGQLSTMSQAEHSGDKDAVCQKALSCPLNAQESQLRDSCGLVSFPPAAQTTFSLSHETDGNKLFVEAAFSCDFELG